MALEPRDAPDRTIGQLVAQVTADLSFLIQKEIELAKTEMATAFATIGKGGGMLAAAGVLALYAFGLLLTTLALVIAIWLPVWAGFLIVGLVLVIIAAILALIGRRNLEQAKPQPERAIAQAKETVATLKSALPSKT